MHHRPARRRQSRQRATGFRHGPAFAGRNQHGTGRWSCGIDEPRKSFATLLALELGSARRPSAVSRAAARRRIVRVPLKILAPGFAGRSSRIDLATQKADYPARNNPTMKTILRSLLLFPMFVLAGAPAWALDGMIGIHDPSTVIQCDGNYYVF